MVTKVALGFGCVATVGAKHRAICNRWLGVLSGTGALGVDFWMYLRDAELGTGFDTNLAFAHNAVMTFGYLLARTAHHQKRMSVLDWGGGVGQ